MAGGAESAAHASRAYALAEAAEVQQALEDHAKQLLAEASEETKDARGKRVTVERLGQRAAKAETEAEKALQRKAELVSFSSRISRFFKPGLNYLLVLCINFSV